MVSGARRSYAIFAKYWRCYTRKIATGAPQHRPGAVVFPGVFPEVDERPPGLPGHPKSDDVISRMTFVSYSNIVI